MKIILTGATGMIGEGVLHECLADPAVTAVLSVSRKPCEVSHAKLKEIIVPDFFDLQSLENQCGGYDACFFCLGVSSIGMKEAEYFNLTYMLTFNFAKTVLASNNNLTFCYISGTNTRSDEKGAMWARVKGKTENDLGKIGFKALYNFRPGFLKPVPGLKRTLAAYKYMGWLYPFVKVLFPNKVATLRELGRAMIKVAEEGFENTILEVRDFKKLV